MRFALFAPILVLGCTAIQDEPAADALPEIQFDEVNSPLPAPGDAALSVTSIIPGDDVTFTVTGLNADELVYIARTSNGLGSGPCFGSADGLCLDVLGPIGLQASAYADGFGTAMVTQTIPSTVPIGADLWFQAVVPRGGSGFSWEKTDVVATTVANAALTVDLMAYGDLVITEVMRDPAAVDDGVGQWIEIYNNTSTDANLDGLVVTDYALDEFTIDATVFLGAGEYAVLAASANPAVNGGVSNVDWEWGNFQLGHDWDEVYLTADGAIIDGVAWDDGTAWPAPTGASMVLEVVPDADANDVGSNWVASDAPWAEDETGDFGSPGNLFVGALDVRSGVITLDNGHYVKCFGGLTVTVDEVDCAYPLFDQMTYSLDKEANTMFGIHNEGEAYEYGHRYILDEIGAEIGYTGSRVVHHNETGYDGMWSGTGTVDNEHCYWNGGVHNWAAEPNCNNGGGNGGNVLSSFTLYK